MEKDTFVIPLNESPQIIFQRQSVVYSPKYKYLKNKSIMSRPVETTDIRRFHILNLSDQIINIFTMFREIKGWIHPSSGKQLAIKQNEQINLKKRSKQNVQKWIILQLKLKTQWARSTADQKQMRREYRHTSFYCAFCFTALRRCCTYTNGGQDPSPGKG